MITFAFRRVNCTIYESTVGFGLKKQKQNKTKNVFVAPVESVWLIRPPMRKTRKLLTPDKFFSFGLLIPH